jgi:hypothetical protein
VQETSDRVISAFQKKLGDIMEILKADGGTLDRTFRMVVAIEEKVEKMDERFHAIEERLARVERHTGIVSNEGT